MWHDSFICETSLIHIWDIAIHRGDTTHSYLRHDSFIYETWLLHMWDTTHLHLRNCYPYDSFHWKCYTLKSTKSGISDSSVSRGTNSNWDFGLIWICTDKFELLDWVNVRGVALLVESDIGETRPLHMWDMTPSYMRYDSFICEKWPIYVWEMTHSNVRHDPFICQTWPIQMWDMTHSCVRHDSFICETWRIHMWDMTFHRDRRGIRIQHHKWHVPYCSRDMTHSHVRHHLFLCATWPVHMWDTTHSYVRRDLFIYEAWPIHMWDMTHSYVSHSSLCRHGIRIQHQ